MIQKHIKIQLIIKIKKTNMKYSNKKKIKINKIIILKKIC